MQPVMRASMQRPIDARPQQRDENPHAKEPIEGGKPQKREMFRRSKRPLRPKRAAGACRRCGRLAGLMRGCRKRLGHDKCYIITLAAHKRLTPAQRTWPKARIGGTSSAMTALSRGGELMR